ncbi:MAG: DUF3793 family protein [Bacillota bacterium]|nr:DUF3793 family protein [Bacillota bacterium]
MSEETIVNQCAPTLAGIKTGNMFSVKYSDEKEILQNIRELNHVLVKKGVRVIPLQKTSNRILIYIYRPDYLERDLLHPLAQRILKEKGYELVSSDRCICQLIRNFRNDSEFPHEVGLFLGYPPADVSGFINSPCEGVKCCGCWKSYSDPEKAEETFIKYRKCTDILQNMNKQGKTLEQLTVKS